MEKEKLSSELKVLVGENSLSPQSWNSYIENSVVPFLPSEEEKIKDYLKSHATSLRSFNGQYNHDVANQVNDFKKNYKPADPVPPQKPDTIVQPQVQDDELKKQLQEFADFKKSIENKEAAKEQAAKRDSLIADAKKKAVEQGAADETILSFVLPLISPTDNDSIETLSAIIKTKYDEAYTKLKGGGYSPASGSGSHNHKGNTASLNAFKDQMIKEGKLPSKNTN